MEISDDLRETFMKSRTESISMCRVCLTVSRDCKLLFDSFPTFAQQLLACTGVIILKDDGYPTNICLKCCSDLKAAYSLHTRCVNSDLLLKKHYFGNKVKIECEESTNVNCDTINNDLPKSSGNVKVENESVFIEENIVKVELKVDDFKSVEYEEENTKAETSNDEDFLQDDSDLVQNEICNKKYECNICAKSLCSKYSLNYHMKAVHNDETVGYVSEYDSQQRYRCDLCPFTTPRRQTLKYHRRTHTGEKPFQCDVCNKCFSQPSALSCHKKTHSDKTYYTCAECGKQFKHKGTYDKHKNVHVDTKNFICSICNKGLKTKATLHAHLNRHYNIKNYSCETCGALFVTHAELLYHAKKHTPIRKFKCDFCSFKTHLKISLTGHLRRHTGERRFKCDTCDVACYTKGELKCHLRKHTKEKIYSCPVCNMKFSHNSSINKHMFNTHGVRYSRIKVDRRIVK